MDTGGLVRRMRSEAGLSLRSLSGRSDLAVSTIHRVEHGELTPTVDTLHRIASATGHALRLDVVPESSRSVLGLGLAIGDDLERGDASDVVRRAAELTARFERADRTDRAWMIGAEPPPTGAKEWDAFLAGFAEWLAVNAGLPAPAWTEAPGRFLDRGWWVTPLPSLRAWEFAGTPVSLQRRGVYLHRESMVNR